MKVYLVEDCENAPGRIYAVFRYEEDAFNFANAFDEMTRVQERNLWNGQPPNQGYNE